MVNLSLITGPTELPVTLGQIKDHLRIENDVTDEDAFVTDCLAAAVAYVDGKDGILGRALLSQTWEMQLDRFPLDYQAIQVPLPPLQSVSSITYTDGDGDSQTWSSSLYTVDTRREPGLIFPIFDQVYPTTRDVRNAVTVQFVAGYGARNAVPETLRRAIMYLVAHWFENREPMIIGTITAALPLTVSALLAPYRMYSFG